MKKKAEFKFKINKLYLYWYYVHFLRKYSIFLFTQNLSLDAKNDLFMQGVLLDNNAEYKIIILDNWMLRKFFRVKQNSGFGYKNWKRIKDFVCLVGLKNIEDILKIEKILKEYKLLIKGYYVQNIFFSKQDWNIKKIDKKNIVENLKQRLNIFYILLIRLILLLKKRI
jgi:hypothetical protein